MRAPGIDEHVGRVLGRRYRLLATIGSGGSARVYLADDLSLRRRVAVKLLHAGLAADRRFARRFETEAQSSAQLNHPHVLAVYDWSDADPAYLVSELLEGGSLRSMLDEVGRVSPSQALLIGLHTAQGLAYAHDRGFVHRDIKPANLLFDLEGRTRIADFGIARAIVEAAWTEPEGALVGTARYAAPEQASSAEVDGRADVYGLALSLVEAVTGVVPLTAPTALATMLLRQHTDLESPPELGSLAAVLDAAGRADPAERIDAEQMVGKLREAATSLPRPRALPVVPLDVDVSDAVAIANDDTGALDVDAEIIDLRMPAGSRPTSILPVTAAPRRRAEDGDVPAMADASVDAGAGGDADNGLVEVEDARRRWPFVALLLLLVGGAVAAYQGREFAPDSLGEVFSAAPITRPMGSFVGRPIEAAQRDIDLNNWVSDVQRIRQDDSEAGQVLTQSPDPGVEWEEGATVVLVVSDGPELRTVPTLVGLDLATASSTLGEARLAVGAVSELNDEAVAAGVVLSASHAPDVELETGTTVDLVVSAGPAPRTVPPLDGATLEQATGELEALGLVVVAAENYSMGVPEGQVFDMAPAPGAIVERGSEVTMTVSLGRPFIDVPDVTGVSAFEATDILEAAGFVVADVEGSPRAEVLATNPPKGERHRFGTSIILFTR